MADIRLVKIGDIVTTNASSYSSKDHWEYVNYLDTGNITQNVIDSIQRIDLSQEKLPSRAKRKVRENSIVYSTVRPNQLHYGIIRNQPENFLVSTGFTVIDVNESQAVAEYIYYNLTQKEIVESLQAIGEQSVSTYPSIKPSDIEDIEIPLPSLDIQNKIVGILKSLDAKIKTNSEINNNLADQAITLFKQYYDQATDEVCFTDLIQILGGGTPKTSCEAYWNGEIPFFTPKDVGNPYVLATEKYITENGLSNCNSRLYPINTVFVTARGTVGKISMPGIPMAMNQSCYALVGKNIPQLLVYFYTLQTVAKLKHKAMGAVFDAITTRDFETEQVRKLDNSAVNDFINIVDPIYRQILSLTIENQRLVALRDTLLPKFMAGEIDVTEVEL